MKPSKELAERVDCGRRALRERGIGIRPGGDALTAEELRGLAYILRTLDQNVYVGCRGRIVDIGAARVWLQMFVDAGASMLSPSQGKKLPEPRDERQLDLYGGKAR